jgi:hypothetical protein
MFPKVAVSKRHHAGRTAGLSQHGSVLVGWSHKGRPPIICVHARCPDCIHCEKFGGTQAARVLASLCVLSLRVIYDLQRGLDWIRQRIAETQEVTLRT